MSNQRLNSLLAKLESPNLDLRLKVLKEISLICDQSAISRLILFINDDSISKEIFHILKKLDWSPTFDDIVNFIETLSFDFFKSDFKLTKKNFLDYYSTIFQKYWLTYSNNAQLNGVSMKFANISYMLIEMRNKDDIDFILDFYEFLTDDEIFGDSGEEMRHIIVRNLGKTKSKKICDRILTRLRLMNLNGNKDFSEKNYKLLIHSIWEMDNTILEEVLLSKRWINTGLRSIGLDFIKLITRKCNQEVIKHVIMD